MESENPKLSVKSFSDISLLRRLRHEGLINDTVFGEALRLLRPASVWVVWTRRMLLFFGLTLVLAGVIYFFAYNWDKMGRFNKFALIEITMFSFFIGAYVRGLDRLEGKMSLLSASVIVGVLLAVYGQIYQTGADAFELFAGWAALISCWVVISSFAGLWFTWLIIVNTAIIFYWVQVASPAFDVRYEILIILLSALNALFLALREIGLKRGLDWLSGAWLRGVLLSAVLIALSIPTTHVIIDLDSARGLTFLCAGLWLLTAFCAFACYRFLIIDMLPIALIVMNVVAIILIFIGKVFFEFSSGMMIYLLFSLVVLGIVTSAIVLLRSIAANIETGQRNIA